MARFRNKGAQKRLLHRFRWQREILLVFRSLAKQTKRHIFEMLNDEEKRFYVTYIFIGGLLVN